MAEEAKNDTAEVLSQPTGNTEPDANTMISPPTDEDANLVSLHKPSSTVAILSLNQVTWDGPTDPANPKNWSQVKKWQITIMVAAFTFVSPISSSMTAPALQQIAEDLDITSSFERNMTLSIYVLALGIGPFFIGPLSEIYGRSKVLQLFNVVYLCFNLGCGFAQNASQLIACRFFAGIGGRYVHPIPSPPNVVADLIESAPLCIGGGVLGDCWAKEERGKSIRIYTLVTLLGPTIGPVIGGFVTQYSTWRWSFFAITIADSVVQFLGLFFLQETFPPKLLGDKAKAMREKTGNSELRTKWETSDRTLTNVYKLALARPFILLFTQPICQIIVLYISYLYGLVYLMLTTFSLVWQEQYHEKVSIAGLNYISIAVGYIIGTQACAGINDIIYKRLTEKHGAGRPEFRLPMLLLGSTLVPIGLFWYVQPLNGYRNIELTFPQGTVGVLRTVYIGSCPTSALLFSARVRKSASSACRRTR